MKPKLILTLSLLVLMISCQPIMAPEPTPTPLPGWRSLVSDLLVEDDVFPRGWARIRDHPQDSLTDRTINHVYRSWWGKAEGTGKVEQTIWRAYTIASAQELYAELRQSQFYVHRTPSPPDFFVAFEPPDEIDFQSQIADEFYLACGWRIWARCEVIARYCNYVVDMRLDQEAEHEEHVTHGLTYAEIEAVVRVMDAKFAEAMETFSTSPP
jgi:hypothetical protein